jgi:hypothetical protein
VNVAMRYRLRTLLILLAVGPVLLAVWWSSYSAWREQRDRRVALEQELRKVNADLVSIKTQTGSQLPLDSRDVAIAHLEEQAAVLQGRRGSAALDDLLKRLRRGKSTKPNP